MKDPAFLFYPGDWLGGTMGMTFEEKGAYIELLMFQFNNDKFTEAHAERMLGVCFTNVWQNIQTKFKTDGTYYWNERLKLEKEKRANFCESRRQSALSISKEKNTNKKKKAYAKNTQQRMEDEDENINKDINVSEDEIKSENKKGKNSKSLHSQLKEIYLEWHRQEIKLEPLFDGTDAPALNVIIKNLKANAERAGQAEFADQIVVDSWKFILDNYKNWDKKGKDYCQSQTRVRQIRTNLTNILINLKNETGSYTADGSKIDEQWLEDLAKSSTYRQV